MVEGLSHITFIVKNLDRTSELLKTVFNAKEVYFSSEKKYSYSKEKFFLVDGLWFVIMEGESLAEKTYNHIALKVAEADLDKYITRVKSLGLEILDDRNRIKGEGKSFYFYDYDNHLFELHTATLDERLEAYRQQEKAITNIKKQD